MIKYYFLAFIIFFSISALNAQQTSCGTSITQEDMQSFYNRDKSHLENHLKGTKAIVNIPVTYHLVADDNGNGAFTMSELLVLHCTLVNDFSDAEVNFYIHDVVSHNSDYYFYMEDNQAGNSMFNNENLPNTCNIFIVKEAKSGGTPVCGYSYLASYGYFLNGNGIMLDMECAAPGTSTLTHEMGHYLNLPHTFSGWEGQDYDLSPIPSSEWERVDGSNCSYTGDGFCDTPPDYKSERWFCSSPVSFDDAVGQNFILDEKNFMSYSADGCAEYFKPEQQAEVNAAPASYRPYLLVNDVPDLSSVSATEIIYPEHLATNLSAHSITFKWNEVSNATHYLVEFTKTTFDNIDIETVVEINETTITNLDLNETYNWRVKAFSYGNACSDYSDFKTFSTASFTIDLSVENISCVGNENGSVTINSSGMAFQISEFNDTTEMYDFVNSTSSNVFYDLAPNEYEIIVVSSSGQQSISYFTVEDVSELEISLNVFGNTISSTVSGGTPPYSYTWSNGSSSSSNNNPVSGDNFLYISDANSCFKSESIMFTPDISPISKVEKLAWNVSIYPNPLVGNTLYVAIHSENNKKANIDLFSIEGKLILSKNTKLTEGENIVEVDFASVSKGVYIIKTTVGTHSISKKLIL